MSETGPQNLPDEALLDLLIKQATEGLSAAEQRALDVLDNATASAYLRDFERAAAAVSLAGTPGEELPSALRARLEDQAQSFLGATPSPNVLNFEAPKAAPVTPGPARGQAWGWLAAAACLVLALFGWLRTPEVVSTPVAQEHDLPPVSVAPPPKIEPTPSEERQALLARADSIKVTLQATKDPAAKGVTADVVWDPQTQKGFAHFAGLATNDPKVQQYQLWIFDGTRDKRYPVDGGVFDVPANSPEVVIPIHATLPIRKAAAFAVTVEKSGGVVVSALGHVVALGTAG